MSSVFPSRLHHTQLYREIVGEVFAQVCYGMFKLYAFLVVLEVKEIGEMIVRK